jgi:hypothetical protein
MVSGCRLIVRCSTGSSLPLLGPSSSPLKTPCTSRTSQDAYGSSATLSSENGTARVEASSQVSSARLGHGTRAEPVGLTRTGLIMAALGMETSSGDFEVVDLCFAGLPELYKAPGDVNGEGHGKSKGKGKGKAEGMDVDGELSSPSKLHPRRGRGLQGQAADLVRRSSFVRPR